MATPADVARIARRSEALKSLSLGEPPLIDASVFRFMEEKRAIIEFNEQQKLRDARLKNLLSEALLAARDVVP